jgi:hypothetical protein
VERYGEGLLITFDSGLLFDFDSDVVRGAARQNLTNLANSLRNYPETEVLIVGHTDNVGSATYNQGLSERRAASARNFLVSQGVPANRIRTMGMGLTEPVASNETEAGRALNRRVEVAIFASEAHRQELLRSTAAAVDQRRIAGTSVGPARNRRRCATARVAPGHWAPVSLRAPEPSHDWGPSSINPRDGCGTGSGGGDRCAGGAGATAALRVHPSRSAARAACCAAPPGC